MQAVRLKLDMGMELEAMQAETVSQFTGSDVLGDANETTNRKSRRLLPWVNYQSQPDVYVYRCGQKTG